MTDLTNRKYTIYEVKDYSKATEEFIKTGGKEYKKIETIIKKLEKDSYYHFRTYKDKKYILYGDIDGYEDIEEYKNKLITFLSEEYKLEIEQDDIKYTKNDDKFGSYHYTIPKYNSTIERMKELHIRLIKKHEEFKRKIDTTIYSNHWFRCPNQSKGDKSKGIHKIVEGEIKDFIIEHIPEDSVDISDIKEIKQEKPSDILILKEENLIKHNESDTRVLSNIIQEPDIYKRLFDECYKQERFDTYDNWISIGMAIKNTFNNEEDAFNLFNYYSSKGSKYEGYEKTKFKYTTFVKKKNSEGYTVATIYFYAKEDNGPKYVEIMSNNTFELGHQDISKYLKVLAGYKFVYKVENNIYKLYSYNGKYWENSDILMRKCIGTELHDFLKNILINIYWNSRDFNILKKSIDRLKDIKMKKDIIETYKEYGVNENIRFDDKWWLLGFNNCIYDMEQECIRSYKYEDYVSITTGYDWIEPSEDELKTVKNLIDQIMPIEEEKELYLQILSTAIDGRAQEHFIIFQGGGGNGKGLLDDLLLLALGPYGLLGNNSILFESSKTGANPEKSNIHKKRLVIFREPSEKNKFENSVIKELTGGGSFSARTHHEKTTQKELNLTMICECNKKPLFQEEPKESELRRLIDIYFRSTFTNDKNKINNKNIYEANPYYKTKEFQEKHKYALLKILFEEHKKFKKGGSIIRIPESIRTRSEKYLELSCDILQWFKDNYKETKDKTALKIKDIYDKFRISEYYNLINKKDKQQYTKKYFVEYFSTNIFTNRYYYLRHNDDRNILLGWVEKDNEDDEIL